MEVVFLIAMVTIVAAQVNEAPMQQQQQQQQIIQNQGHQQIKIDQLQHQQMNQQGVNVVGGRNLIRDKTHVQNRDHIKLHLNGIIDQDEKDMSEKELELHYFKMHDYDNNMKLDGLEILQAVSHFHHEGDTASGHTTPLDDSELMKLIDPILEEDDKNKDGYVDYPEFASNKV